jgi:hypothetical protein
VASARQTLSTGIRTTVALLVADLVAAALFTFWLYLEALIDGAPFVEDAARLSFFMVLVSAGAGLPALAFGALPVWLAFRQRRVTSMLWLILAGSLLAAGYFVILVAAGLGAGSDGALTFAENISRRFQLLRTVAAACSGAAAGATFHQIVRPQVCRDAEALERSGR